MKHSNINPSCLDGKIIEMEITASDVVVYNRKENTQIKLFNEKSFDMQK